VTPPACGELFPAVPFLALAALLLVTFRGALFAVVLFRVAFLLLATFRGAFLLVVLFRLAFLALAGLRLVTFRGVFFLVVLFRVAFLALLRRVFFLAAISARSLFDSVTSGDGSLANRLERRVMEMTLFSKKCTGCGDEGEP